MSKTIFEPSRPVGRPPGWRTSAMNACRYSWLNVLLVFVPISWAMHFSGQTPTVVFITSFAAIVPLAALLGFATEEMALRLLNATFGNCVELIISILALVKGELRIVQSAMLGSILSNCLLVLGMCYFAGGLRFHEQGYGIRAAQLNINLLGISVAAIVIPVAFHVAIESAAVNTPKNADADVLKLSRGIAIILLFIYGAYLTFQLWTHAYLYIPAPRKPDDPPLPPTLEFIPGPQPPTEGGVFRLPSWGGSSSSSDSSTGDEESGREKKVVNQHEPKMSLYASLSLLTAVTVLTGFTAEWLVDSISGLTATGNISTEFVAVILLPLVGNAAEHVTAVTVATKGKLDLSMAVAVGSSIQISLFVIPLLILLGWIIGQPLSLYFDPFETLVLFVSIVAVNWAIADGRTNWLEGLVLMTLYFLVALVFWYYQVFGHHPPPEFTLPDFTPEELANRARHANLLRLVESYRRHGHRAAKLDPLDLAERPNVPALDPRRYGFNVDAKILRTDFISEALPGETAASGEKYDIGGIMDWPGGEGSGEKTIEDIAFMHLPSKHERRFLERLLEQSHATPIPTSQQLAQWRLLARSEGFDSWAAKRFPNVKRYGLEGGEGTMVALGVILQLASEKGINDCVLAMPHRGRLNILTQLLDLDMRLLVRKMRGLPTLPPSLPVDQFSDDVLSHLFLTTTLPNSALRVHFLPNPSHLEAVNPVALGFARALQVPFGPKVPTSPDGAAPALGDSVLSLQVHGDAAFAGQGVVAESLNLANLPHFSVGGTVRLVVNNQIGYTADARAGRTSFYASDLAKSIAAPILHVNGDRIDDVARAMTMAFAYQQKFRKVRFDSFPLDASSRLTRRNLIIQDVVIDLVVYRRRGHNELDAPEYTSPVMYKVIEKLPTVPQIYEQELIAAGTLDSAEAATARKEHLALLDEALVAAEPANFTVPELELERGWDRMRWPKEGEWEKTIDTGVDPVLLAEVGRRSVEVPEDITIHPRLKRIHIAKRLSSIETGEGIDFSTAEALAFGSLLSEGKHVRLCGQDSGRGTFSQRHGVLSDQTSTRTTVPLQSLHSNPPHSRMSTAEPGAIEIVNSPLSEYAVVGFEQGASWVSPDLLPIWEAQFGDFADPAQVIIDTFLGGARIERFLQLTNEPMSASEAFVPNIHLINVTTAAQYFHLLRRQLVRDYRKPLVVFSPKGILRLPAAASKMEDFAPGTSFQSILVDTMADPSLVSRVVILSGKMYYDLTKLRADLSLDSKVAFIRLEEISPFPYNALRNSLASFPNSESFIWAQEEPENAGAFTFVKPRIEQVLPTGGKLEYAGRKAMATPAPGVGSYFSKQKEVSMNYWNALNLAASAEAGGNQSRFSTEMQQMADKGVNNLRIMASSEASQFGIQPFRMYPALMTSPGVYNEEIFIGLDRTLAKMATLGMTAVMTLNNFCFLLPFTILYVSWATNTTIPYPPSWDPTLNPPYGDYTKNGSWGSYLGAGTSPGFPEYASRLYNDTSISNLTNTCNGRIYKDDATIMTWELMNEPQDPPLEWVTSTADFIKSLAPKQLVTVGSRTGGITTHSLPTRAVSRSRSIEIADRFLSWVSQWSVDIGKPVILEEFGMARDNWENVAKGAPNSSYLYDSSAGTTHKDTYFTFVLLTVLDLWKSGKAWYDLYDGDHAIDIVKHQADEAQAHLKGSSSS
ncbi:hypothetical protein RQP46_008537 [Phenoliferia psychrophenolica]